MKFFSYFARAIEILFRLFYLALAVYLIINLTHLFGFHILTGVLKGGDAGFASHNLVWYARWFPKIPIWYPLQGGGFAFSLSYAIAPSLVAVLTERLTGLDLTQSLRAITFSSYLLGAFGVYFLGSWRLKNQTIGLIAAVFFLTTSGAWFWITRLGYYAFAIATGLIPWGLIFFDWFLESLIEKQQFLKVLVKLFLASLVLGLAFLFHTFVGTSLSLAYFFYGPITGWLTAKKLLSLKGISWGTIAAFLVSLFSVLLFSFWFLPVFRYNRLAARDGLQTEAAEQLVRWAQVQNWRRLLFDYDLPEKTDVLPQPSFSRLMTSLVLLGLPIALILRIRKKFFPSDGQSKVLGLAALGFGFLFWSSLPAYLKIEQVEKLKFVFSWLQYRVISISYAVFPIVAAFCIYAAFWILTELVFWPLLFFKKKAYWPRRLLKGLAVAIFSLLAFFYLLIGFERGLDGRDSVSFGPFEDPVFEEKAELGYQGFYFRDCQYTLQTCLEKKEAEALGIPYGHSCLFHCPSESIEFGSQMINPQYALSLLKKSFAYSAIKDKLVISQEISSEGFGKEKEIKKLNSHMELDQFTRVGLTGLIGSLFQEWGSYTDASTVNQFMYKGSLFQGMRGFSESVFFSDNKDRQKPKLLSDLARWLGYRYVVVMPEKEQTDHYLSSEWEEVGKESPFRIYEFKDWQQMTTLTRRSVILVIGKKVSAHDSVFRATSAGVLPYQKAWLVEGEKERLDQYSLDELKKFDGLILYGYSYRSGNRAFSLLSDYVSQGGKVFIDTGWQFFSKDWELEKTPDFLPVDKLRWGTDIDPGNHQVSSQSSVNLGISEIPIEWKGQNWGLSIGEGLKDWAEAFLTVDGKTLIAGGSYGKGKIVWSGLNLFGYLSYHQYHDDLVGLGASVFDYLYPETSQEEKASLTLKRDFPDKVEIKINQAVTDNTWLLWREPYSPDWKISLEGWKFGQPPVYRAGPGFLLIPLTKTNGPSKLTLEYKLGLTGFLGKLVSFLTLFFFAFLIIDSLFLKGKFSQKTLVKLTKGLKEKKKHFFGRIRKQWVDEEDY